MARAIPKPGVPKANVEAAKDLKTAKDVEVAKTEDEIAKPDELKDAAKNNGHAAKREKKEKKEAAKKIKTGSITRQAPDRERYHMEYIEVDGASSAYAPAERGDVLIYRERAETRGLFGLFGE